MNLEETLRLKALKLKQLSEGGDFSDVILDQLVKDSPETRNICAHISVPLFDEVDNLCSLFEMSKRRFVEMALTDAIAKAHAVLGEVNPFDLKGQ
jgi:hypothetical protein